MVNHKVIFKIILNSDQVIGLLKRKERGEKQVTRRKRKERKEKVPMKNKISITDFRISFQIDRLLIFFDLNNQI